MCDQKQFSRAAAADSLTVNLAIHGLRSLSETDAERAAAEGAREGEARVQVDGEVEARVHNLDHALLMRVRRNACSDALACMRQHLD